MDAQPTQGPSPDELEITVRWADHRWHASIEGVDQSVSARSLSALRVAVLDLLTAQTSGTSGTQRAHARLQAEVDSIWSALIARRQGSSDGSEQTRPEDDQS